MRWSSSGTWCPVWIVREVGDALFLALRVVGGEELDLAARQVVAGRHVARAQPLFLLAVDEALQVARREAVLVDVERPGEALDRRELVLRVEDLELARQSCVLVMRAQEAVRQAMKGADPQAARAHRQHRREARQHFARRLVGERDREHAAGRDLAVLDEPGDAGGKYAGLAAAGARKHERVAVG